MLGQRAAGGWASALSTTAAHADDSSITITAEDPAGGLRLVTELELSAAGVLLQRHILSNTGDSDYLLHRLTTVFPLPASATTVQDFTGRHLKERTSQRRPLTVGAHVRESRRGRPGADATLLMLAGQDSFGFRSGLVHGVHTAWSGNHSLSAERTITSDSFLSAGELLLPGRWFWHPGIRTPPRGRWVPGATAWTSSRPDSTKTCAPAPNTQPGHGPSHSIRGKPCILITS
ncbi:glycoside hydrolase family 36 N-terminal domain-containing protein [Arthrobacter alpinus]|nr:glycoside hydrolase family 36 N-terminal domain-containing protein [Arthrobacter alpinus]